MSLIRILEGHLAGMALDILERMSGAKLCTELSTVYAVERQGSCLAVVAFHDYRPEMNIEVSIAAESPRWAHPDVIATLLAYPFRECGLRRVTASVRADNEKSRRLVEGLGFVSEGLLRQSAADGQDMLVYGMVRSEYLDRYGKRALVEVAKGARTHG